MIEARYYPVCNGCGEHPPYEDGQRAPGAAMAEALAHGWKIDRSGSNMHSLLLCPTCVATQEPGAVV